VLEIREIVLNNAKHYGSSYARWQIMSFVEASKCKYFNVRCMLNMFQEICAKDKK